LLAAAVDDMPPDLIANSTPTEAGPVWVIFSTSASEKNDENLVIVRGDKRLAQIYAVHVQIVYDHFTWRAFLAEGGDPCTLYASLSGWETGSKARDLAFWMLDPVG
jgi:hypothetical protein